MEETAVVTSHSPKRVQEHKGTAAETARCARPPSTQPAARTSCGKL